MRAPDRDARVSPRRRERIATRQIAPGTRDLRHFRPYNLGNFQPLPTDAEALVIAGNGLRAVGTIAALEAELERPVVTANQALLWAALRHLGGPNTVTRYGRLFQTAAGSYLSLPGSSGQPT